MSTPATQFAVWSQHGTATERVGVVWSTQRRDQVSVTVDYDSAWLASRSAHAISPDLPLSSARHHLVRLPGAFADCSPDRWGRMLIDKRSAAAARLAGATPPLVGAVDYLLGVSDLTRQGALRFSVVDGGPFLAVEPGVPALVELPRLLRAADEVDSADGSMAAVKALLDAGSAALGGVRPKASVRDGDVLAIAKFPHRADAWDVMAWEKTALDLAARAGIRGPRSQLVPVDGRHALVLDRFDRVGGRRVGYVSALTLVGGVDGVAYDYLEVAEALAEHGSNVGPDLAELWRRIAFGLLVNNTDDHLRNLGALRRGPGWTLSPAFDLNPNPDPSATSVTTVAFAPADRSAALDALVGAAGEFGLTVRAARQVLAEVAAAVSTWREVAATHGQTGAEQDRFADALDALAPAGR